jgi:hypothetical protein
MCVYVQVGPVDVLHHLIDAVVEVVVEKVGELAAAIKKKPNPPLLVHLVDEVVAFEKASSARPGWCSGCTRGWVRA